MAVATTAAEAEPRVLAAAPPGLRAPLTELVLARLPGPRLAWLAAWGLLPFAAYEIAYIVDPWPSYAGITSNLAFGLVNLFGLWATGRLAARVAGLQPTLARLLSPEQLVPGRHPFRRVGSVSGPLVVSAIMTAGWDIFDFVRYPSLTTALLVALVFIGQLGIVTFLWTYATALFGLDRIGRHRLNLDSFVTDPNLGLGRLGALSFEAFLLSGALTLPIIIMAAADLRGLIGALVVLLIMTGLFFLSAHSLHRTLAEAKAGHVRWARELVGIALEPVRKLNGAHVEAEAAGRALDAATSRLATAVEVERRALSIQDWPFNAAIMRAVVAILTSATAAIGARLLLAQLGV